MSMFLQQQPWKKKKRKLPVENSADKTPCRTLTEFQVRDQITNNVRIIKCCSISPNPANGYNDWIETSDQQSRIK
eukprot:1751660-Ditylum_brightwellii.AAC.1